MSDRPDVADAIIALIDAKIAQAIAARVEWPTSNTPHEDAAVHVAEAELRRRIRALAPREEARGTATE